MGNVRKEDDPPSYNLAKSGKFSQDNSNAGEVRVAMFPVNMMVDQYGLPKCAQGDERTQSIQGDTIKFQIHDCLVLGRQPEFEDVHFFPSNLRHLGPDFEASLRTLMSDVDHAFHETGNATIASNCL